MRNKNIAGVAGVLVLLVAAAGSAWAGTQDTTTPAAASTSSPKPPAIAGSSKVPEAQASATPASTGGTTRIAPTSKSVAASKGRIAATISRPGATGCTLLGAYRVVDGEPRKVATFGDDADRRVSGKLSAGTYVFLARDDCDTDLAEVWVGGTSSNDARRFTVKSGRTTQLGTITMVSDPSLSLTFVSEADGTPVVGEPFDVLDSSGSIVWSWSTDEAGRIQTSRQPMDEGEKSLRAGTYRFRVAGNDFEKIDFTIDLRDDVARTFTLTPLG